MEQKLFHELLDRIGLKWQIGVNRSAWSRDEEIPIRGYTVVLPQTMTKCDWCGIATNCNRYYRPLEDGDWIGKCALRGCRKQRKIPINQLTKEIKE